MTMCLSSAYAVKNGNETLVLEDVKGLVVEQGTVTLTDLMGYKAVASGVIKSVDLVKNVVFIEAMD